MRPIKRNERFVRTFRAVVLLPAMLSASAAAQPVRAAVADPVEIVDWVGIVGISRDSTQQFEVVRSASFPFQGSVNESYFPTGQTPAGEINAYFDTLSTEGAAEFSCRWNGNVSSASGDGSTDGPFAVLAVLIRTAVPVTYTAGSYAYLGIGAGDASNTPYAKAAIDVGFCFTPGASPQAGSEFCGINPATDLMSIFHVDTDAFETSLSLCCAVVPDEGSPAGVLPPGEYTLYVESGTEMNVLFGGGSFSEATGGISMALAWDPPCPADLNGDGIADSGNIQTFIDFFLAQDLAVDFNGDGIIDQGDIQGFVAVFLAGC